MAEIEVGPREASVEACWNILREGAAPCPHSHGTLPLQPVLTCDVMARIYFLLIPLQIECYHSTDWLLVFVKCMPKKINFSKIEILLYSTPTMSGNKKP